MKRILFVCTLMALVFWSLPALAKEERVYVPSGEPKAGNYYAAGQSVEVAGDVESDLVVVGGDVVVTGAVGGDVIAAGGNVRVTGPVGGNVRVFGGRVELAGTVERNVTAAAGELVLTNTSDVKGHVTVAGGKLDLRGRIGGSLLGAAGQVTAEGTVEGPATFWLDRQGTLDIREKAAFGKSLTYYSNQDAFVAQGASLSEQPQRHALPAPKRTKGGWFGHLVSLFGSLVLAMVVVKLKPAWVQTVSGSVLQKPLQSLGIGAAWVVVTPIAFILLSVTIIGLPVAMLVLLAYVAGFILVPVIAGASVAEYLKRPGALSQGMSKLSPFVAVAIGIVVYKIVTLIPLVGGFICLVAVLLGVGALVRITFAKLSPSHAVQS